MKALSPALVLILIIASCSSKDASAPADTGAGTDSGAHDSDTGETAETAETAESGDTDTGDTGSETGDTGDTGDTAETGDTGTADDILGPVYDLNLASATVTKPEGIGSVLSSFWEEDLLAEVESSDDTTITFLIGVGTSAGQDRCGATSTFTADFTGHPTFSASEVDIGPIATQSFLGNLPIALLGATVGATFSEDGTTSADGSVVGWVPMGLLATSPDIADLAGCDGTADAACVCTFIAGTGFARCETCPDGSEGCLAVEMSDIASSTVDVNLVAVAQNNCDPECDASADNPDCDRSGW